MIGFEESFNSFPAIPAQVSAYGRMYLWQLMKQVGAGNYFYCDTDSLIVNEVGLCRLQNRIDDTKLGFLKVVSSPTAIAIRGLKDYSVETKQVIKGIRRNAVEIREGVYEQEQWPSFQGLLRVGQADVYTVKTVRKVLDRKYTKGRVKSDGTIAPLALSEFFERSLLPH